MAFSECPNFTDPIAEMGVAKDSYCSCPWSSTYRSKSWHFEAIEDIMTKFISQGLHIIRIKYWNANGSGPHPSFVPALWIIGILLHKQATLGKHFCPQCNYNSYQKRPAGIISFHGLGIIIAGIIGVAGINRMRVFFNEIRYTIFLRIASCSVFVVKKWV